MLSPSSDTLSGSSVTITASATDNLGAAGITLSLYINGVLKSSATGGSLSYKWTIRRLVQGTYVLQVVARDAAGNSSTASRQVIK